MKLPLRIGVPLLIGLLLASGLVQAGAPKTVLLVLAMGVALWTAFSIPRPRPKDRPETRSTDEEEP